MNRVALSVALFLLAGLAGRPIAQADVIVLKSGTVIEGTTDSVDATKVVLQVEGGSSSLERSSVASIHFGISKADYERQRRAGPAQQTAAAAPADVIEWGAPAEAEGITLAVASVRVGTTAVHGFGGPGRGTNPDLQIALAISNTSDRKILRYDTPNRFMASPFQLRDDVDNVIRGVRYGAGSEVVGALTGNEDFEPGSRGSHLLVFAVPPPKTKFLILSVDLSVFGCQVIVRFSIPAERIEGFAAR
ncbi:MAG: hypothetical protein R3F05_10930 [Planctomycetota bacterium]